MTVYHDGVKSYDHPEVGRLTFDYTMLDVPDERYAPLRLVTYLPAVDTDTQERMETWLGAVDKQPA